MRYYTFEVEGAGAFPIDMLRYDRCFPDDESESSKIAQGGKRSKGHRRVALGRYAGAPFAPSVGRWASFGWTVVPKSLYRHP